jgi:hypothetical protein
MTGISNIARFCTRPTLERYASSRLVTWDTPLPIALNESSTTPTPCSCTHCAL